MSFGDAEMMYSTLANTCLLNVLYKGDLTCTAEWIEGMDGGIDGGMDRGVDGGMGVGGRELIFGSQLQRGRFLNIDVMIDINVD